MSIYFDYCFLPICLLFTRLVLSSDVLFKGVGIIGKFDLACDTIAFAAFAAFAAIPFVDFEFLRI